MVFKKGRMSGENNPFYGKHHTEEFKRRMRLVHKGQIPWCTGKKLTTEHRKKLSLSHKGLVPWNKGKKGAQVSWMKGKHHTSEANEKNRLSHLGKSAWNKGKHTGQGPWNIAPWNKGKKDVFSEESRRKMSLSAKTSINQGRFKENHKFSEESKLKMSSTHKAKPNRYWLGKTRSEEVKLKLKEARIKQIFPVKDTKIEIKIQNFLKQLEIKFLAHKYIKEIEHSYQCDVYIPSINLIIECDGDYWHVNPKSNLTRLSQRQIEQIQSDKIRTKELQEKGFNVLRLWESEIKPMNIQEFKDKLNKFN